ncbi:hypothetical protein ABY45_04650 [Microbacterium maritypicum]|uniref:Uncharacterized protein n=2 Tax=Microbacterium maritypicum TaxID=33918 RepID=A0AAD3X132_MICMQ|nr:hypothetical protein CVS53_00622 [Microbacterium oxydans]EYT57508.1 lipoprotein [Microbacterium sp. UCD-TDU]KAB1883417.1 hypothetical protein F6W70_12415 [Microbacterium liquefaciens]KQV00309.1 hypothetical protein ASC55_14045 [Microbacterium sp. Root322]MBP5800788.1 hypothetical protein [Microbacterium liquefaciens]
MQTMARTRIALNESEFFLAQGQDVAELRGRMEGAMRAGGGFVEFVVVGNRAVSVLITAATQVVISVETVEYDARDTGDSAVPYGGEYDLL